MLKKNASGQLKKTVLVIANEWTTIIHFRMEILERIVKAGYRTIVALPLCKEAMPIRDTGCKLVNLHVARHGKNPLDDIKTEKQCKKIIKKYHPNVVITYTVKPNIYGSYACKSLHLPYINNITGVGAILQSRSPVARLMLIMMSMAFKKSSCVFFQNRDNYNRFLKEKVITKKTNIDFLPGSGVNLDKFSYVPYPKEGPTKFVIVSRVRRDKGYVEYFDAAERIKRKYPEIEFHVVGWYEDLELRERVDSLNERGIIIYHGELQQEEVHELIAQTSCLVHPSYHEGMANVILEAAATGRPVIASHIGGCKEAVEDEKTGFLCEVKSSQSLINSLERFIATSMNKREEMGMRGRNKMENEFDRQIVADKLLNQIEMIINSEEK